MIKFVRWNRLLKNQILSCHQVFYYTYKTSKELVLLLIWTIALSQTKLHLSMFIIIDFSTVIDLNIDSKDQSSCRHQGPIL